MKKLLFFLVNMIITYHWSFSQSTLIQPGVVLPQVTTSQRTSLFNPTNGMLVFDTNTQSYWYRQSSSWVELPKGGSSSNYWELNGVGGNVIKNTNSGGFWSANPSVVTGSNALVIAPVNGEGTRLMWLPYSSSFRVGTVRNNLSDEGTWWDTSNIGLYSIGIGQNTKASASGAMSIGNNSSATGPSSITLGAFSEAKGLNSLAIGNVTVSEGWRAIALGSETNAFGNHAVAIGYGTAAFALGSTSVGSFNENGGYIDATVANASDRIFQVGNGSPTAGRSNAITVLRNGNVGIGAINPVYNLQVQGNSYNSGDFRVNGNFTVNGLTSFANINIGTGIRLAPLHVHGYDVVATASAYYTNYGYNGVTPWYLTSSSQTWATGLLVDYDIVGKRSIVSAQNVTTSDARIKNILGVSDNQQDLEKLKKIKITDYHYKDVANWGSQTFKKVIAQQVEEVYPQAVRKQTSTIPDIYCLTEKVVYDETKKELTITLSKNYEVKVGDKIEMIHAKKGKMQAEVITVLGNSFTVKEWLYPTEKIFVYGREVNDFRVVDYEALSMLGISATQQLAKENEELKKEIIELKKVSANWQQLNERLEAIESSLGKSLTGK